VKSIRVSITSSPYNVIIGQGTLAQAGKQIISVLGRRPAKCCVITAQPIWKHWGKVLEASLKNAGLNAFVLKIPDGERHKNLHEVEKLLVGMAKHGADRTSIVIALGGGVVCDMAGFAASIYMRGIPVVQLPSTLLAQVDAAIGGKTGVDLKPGKNLAGSFHQPHLVIEDTETLRTLPQREYRAGLFEVIKCGIIRDPRLFQVLEDERKAILARKQDPVQHIIEASVKVKADVVSADEREGDLRRVLNFGHTIGHAIEAATGYKQLLHGEAVAWGMIAAIQISCRMKTLNNELATLMTDQIKSYGPLPAIRVRREHIISFLASDKKNVAGVPHFILLAGVCSTVVRNDVPMSLIREVIDSLLTHSKISNK